MSSKRSSCRIFQETSQTCVHQRGTLTLKSPQMKQTIIYLDFCVKGATVRDNKYNVLFQTEYGCQKCQETTQNCVHFDLKSNRK